ncbi:MAG: glycosyltransferase [Azospirillaceae bacterium]|nr:glycosyltransferase [Azospirillaceae bacterium]
MKILIVAAGSHGDVLPFIALGRELRRRGHQPHLYAAAPFRDLAVGANLPFTSLGTAEFYHSLLRDPDMNHPIRSLTAMGRALDQADPGVWATMSADVVPGDTLVIGSTLGFITRSLAERYDLPSVTVHLAPAILRTEHQAPRHGGMAMGSGTPRLLKRFAWYLADRLLVDRTLGAAVNRHRRQVGLPPVRRLMGDWLNQADLVIGMFPDWFAPPQPDWPANLFLAGFPLYDQAFGPDLPDALASFLAAGTAPVAFTAGTATALARDFFVASVEGCRRIGRRGVLLTRHADQVPDKLPPDFIRVDYAPFSRLLPRVAALVHHGGIGTTSQALAAGVPQLIRPMAHDQHDNAARCVRLGVAEELSITRYGPKRVAAALNRLLGDAVLHRRCAAVAARLAAGDAVAAACDHILALAATRGGGQPIGG